MKKLKNLKVGAKILLGYVFALLLMILVGAVALVRISQISNVVADLADDLARDQHLADAIAGESWAVRYYAERHINKNSAENLSAYKMQSEYLDTLLDEARQQITEPGRVEMLGNLDESFHKFDAAFLEIANLLNSRQIVVEQQLDVLGPRTQGEMDMLRRLALEDDNPEIIFRISAVQQALMEMRFDVARFLSTGDVGWAGKFQLHYQQAQAAFNTLNALVQAPEMVKLLSDAEKTIAAYHDAFTRLESNYQRQQSLIETDLAVLGPEMRNIGIGMVASVEQDFAATKENVDAVVWQTRLVLVVTIGLAVIFGLTLGLVVARNITRPLHRVTQTSQQIADVDLLALSKEMAALSRGDLARSFSISAQPLAVTSNDEIGQMSQAFNNIINRLQDAGVDFEQMTGSLRQLVGRVAENATHLNASSNQLSEAAQQAGEAAGQVSLAIEQVASGTQQQAKSITRAESTVEQVVQTVNQVAAGAQEQATAVSQSVEMTTQISQIIKQVADNAQAGSQGALEAANAAQQGAFTVQATIDGMARIREKVGVSAASVQEMGQRSSQIGAIVETIDTIAAQTNLLALNAAIEAARAGEHGKGFAVVADEVRKLAEKSTDATKEIEGLIQSIKTTVDDAVAAMADGTVEVEAGVARAGEARAALEKILSTTGQVRNQVEEIAGSAQEMSQSAKKLVQIMETVSAVVEENTDSTRAMTRSSQGITHEIEDIALVGQTNNEAVQAVSAATTQMTAQIEGVGESAAALNQMAAELQTLVAQFNLHSQAEPAANVERAAPATDTQPVTPDNLESESASGESNLQPETEVAPEALQTDETSLATQQV